MINKIILIFGRWYNYINTLSPLMWLGFLIIIAAAGGHIIVYLLDLPSFMPVVYCQPTDSELTNNISELANAEVIIKSEDSSTSHVKVNLNKEENKVNILANLDSDHLKTALTHLGAGTAAGSVGAAVVNSLKSSTISTKIAAGAIGVGVTGAAFILAGKATDVAIANAMKKNEATTPKEEVLTTPTDPNDVFSASSFLDSIESDIPLISLINILFEFINLELILLLVLIFLILKQRFKIGTKILTFIKNKIPNNKPYLVKIHNFFDLLIIGNNEIDQSLILIYLILMLLVKLVLLYFMLELKINIDDYVYVYNKIKKIIN